MIGALGGCFAADGTIGSVCHDAADCGPEQRCHHELCGRCGNGRHESGELCYADPVAIDGPVAVAGFRVADLDGDGRDEIVTLDDGGVVRHWLARSAGAAFVGTAIDAAAAATAFALGDADGDGRGDIVVASQASVTVHAGAADGTFADVLQLDVGHSVAEATVVPATEAPATLAFVDDLGSLHVIELVGGATARRIDVGTKVHIGPAVYFDDDEYVDLAVVDERQNRLAVVTGGTWDGVTRVGVGRGPTAVVGYDREGDGRTDFLTLDRFGHTVTVVAASGDGDLRLLDGLAFALAPTAATAFDADLDGTPDVFVATSEAISFWRGEAGRYPEPVRLADGGVDAIAVGRFTALPLFDLVALRGGVLYRHQVDP